LFCCRVMVVVIAALLVIAVPCSANFQTGTESYQEIRRLLRDSEKVGSSPVSPCRDDGRGCLGAPGGSPVNPLWDPPKKRAVYYQGSMGQPRRIALVRRNYLRFGKRSGSYETTTARQGFRVPPSSGIIPPTREMSEEEQENLKLRNFVNFFKNFDQVPSSPSSERPAAKRSSALGEPEDLQQENTVAGEMEKRARDYIRFGKRAQDYIRFGKRAQGYIRFGKRDGDDTPRIGKYLNNKRKSDNYLRFGKRANANFIRFGKKNDLGIFGTTKFSQDEHSEEDDENGENEDENAKLNDTKDEFNNGRFEKRKTQNFIRFGKRSDDNLHFGRNDDFTSGERGQEFGKGRIPLEKRSFKFKNCVETFSQEMCRRLPQIMSLRNSKRMNYLRYGKKR